MALCELPSIQSNHTVCFYAATSTVFWDVIIMSICSAGTVALPDGEENPTELPVFHTHLHFGPSSGNFGILVAELHSTTAKGPGVSCHCWVPLMTR